MSFEMREGEVHSLSFLYEEGQSDSSDPNLQPISFLTKALNFEQSDISLDIFPNSLSKRHSYISSLQASKISSDLHESWKYSKEVSEIFPGHHMHAPSVLVKSGAQNYNGILNELNLERDSMTPDSQDFEEGSIDYSLTDEEDEANKETILNYPTSKVQAEFSTPTAKNSLIIPTKEEIKGVRASTIYTNLSSDSSAMITSYLSNNSSKLTARKNAKNKPEPEEEFEVVEIKPKRLQTDRSIHASVRKSTLAFPNLLYCPTCNEDTYSIINFQVQNLGFIDSVRFFFNAIRCCREANSLSKYQEVVHTCRKCKNVLARVRFA
ncbi:unnamed protein product [Blepharisma stoltei]|uniref:LITAF domain-containing protein n=1 Tax=Blepharisma stoltei TaxID=1481888 RepID=A0AAU9JNS1_9CILI|nr:unnamed protein product [Blepharisma stoltei]